MHALYAFARTADDIVDLPVPSGRPGEDLQRFGERFFTELATGQSDHPVLAAVVDTVRRFEIEPELFERFLASMTMDLSVSSYGTWTELFGYMDGSAAAIGEMMLPILDPVDRGAALGPARDLGVAFQLTNFLRDIDEDLDRGRVYVPRSDLERFGVDLHERRATTGFVDLMRFEIERCRQLYASAEAGIEMLPGRSARCIRAAHSTYGGILDEIERQGYDVFAGRASVPGVTKLRLVTRELVR